MATRFMKDQSPEYQDAVRALKALMRSTTNGTNAATRAYAEAVSEDDKKFYAGRAGKLSSGSHVCVHRLLDKPCPARRRFAEELCGTAHLPAADHLSEWRDKNGKRRIVSQPYGLGYESLKQMVAFCERMGLEVYIDAWPAWHFPGRTLFVEYRKKRMPGED